MDHPRRRARRHVRLLPAPRRAHLPAALGIHPRAVAGDEQRHAGDENELYPFFEGVEVLFGDEVSVLLLSARFPPRHHGSFFCFPPGALFNSLLCVEKKNSLLLTNSFFSFFGTHSLAYCELTLIIAALFRPDAGAKFDLFETTEEDVEPCHDLIVPLPKLGTKGVRLLFH